MYVYSMESVEFTVGDVKWPLQDVETAHRAY